MSKITTPIIALALAGSFSLIAQTATAWTIDFEKDGAGTDMVNGQVLDNEYANGIAGSGGIGVTISATNWVRSCYGPSR